MNEYAFYAKVAATREPVEVAFQLDEWEYQV